ncbi:MAG: aminodeoxychorismate/anthranilate synthase component II, partial [Alphaproteobacteria bacterium]|nr:aminodeoxychorismate/anthranilate synthase component II [Alphaproteobacteria bacterium]
MILLIDNYDSFVHNLARYVGQLGRERQVVRNDAITLDAVAADPPEAIILSPGPCTPQEAGISCAIVRHFSGRVPILGVCLGHQCIGEVFGGRIIRAPSPVHGRASLIEHNADGLFMGLPNPLEGGRYHSLIVELNAGCPLRPTATTDDEDAILMALQHETHPTFGIQF